MRWNFFEMLRSPQRRKCIHCANTHVTLLCLNAVIDARLRLAMEREREDLVKLSVGIRAATLTDGFTIDFINKQS